MLQAAANGVGGAGEDRPDLDAVLRDHQVVDDEMVKWRPNAGPLPIDIPGVGKRDMTRTEAEPLDELGWEKGLNGLRPFDEITSDDPGDLGLAYATANERFPQVDGDDNAAAGGEDGHNDAVRHACWNAPMTDRFGEGFGESFATAHEGVPGPADKEAMDLFNNELGRRIATGNPGAPDEELADLVFDAVRSDEAVVIDGRGELAFCDRVAVGETGSADDPAANGRITPPDYDASSR